MKTKKDVITFAQQFVRVASMELERIKTQVTYKVNYSFVEIDCTEESDLCMEYMTRLQDISTALTNRANSLNILGDIKMFNKLHNLAQELSTIATQYGEYGALIAHINEG